MIRRYLLSSVHQDTIVEEAADQARDHGHDVIATWLEVCCCWSGVQACLSLMFHSACSRLSASRLCISLAMPATSRCVLLVRIVELLHTCALICSQWVRRILLTDSYLDIEKLSHDGLTPLDVARKSGADDGWLAVNARIVSVRWTPTC